MPRAPAGEHGRRQSSTSTREACLECRFSKIKCTPASASPYPCLRCAKNGFRCMTDENRKPVGRKAKSKLAANSSVAALQLASTSHTPSASSSSSRARYANIDAARCRNALVSILKSSASSSSTYTFVSDGKGDIAQVSLTEKRVRDANKQTSSEQKDANASVSLRYLLHPVNLEREALGGVSTSAAVGTTLPDFINTNQPRDPRELDLVSSERAAVLVDYFDQHLSPWTAALDPEYDITTSMFLYTVILLQASRYINDRPREVDVLTVHARTLATLTFAEGDTSQEVILALYLFAMWKSADETCCDMYTSYADRIAIMMARTRTGRRWERTQLFHYVQQSVFLLHYSPSSANLLKRDDLRRKCQSWSRHPDSLVGDWFLCADVESTALQCQYKSLLDEQERRLPNVNCTPFSGALLAAFHSQVEDWEQRWKAEAERRESTRNDPKGRTMRLAGLSLFRNSVCFQISSIALSQALRHRGSASIMWHDEDNFNYLTRTYELCVDSALGILLSVLQLETDAELLLHMPDSLVVLAAHATQLIVYLLVAPHAGPPPSLSSQSSSQELLYFDSILTRVSRENFSRCLDTMDQAQSLMAKAAALRPPLQTAVLLCSNYMASLISVFRACIEQEPLSLAALPVDLDPGGTLSGDFSQGWDWLESFLSQSVVV